MAAVRLPCTRASHRLDRHPPALAHPPRLLFDPVSRRACEKTCQCTVNGRGSARQHVPSGCTMTHHTGAARYDMGAPDVTKNESRDQSEVHLIDVICRPARVPGGRLSALLLEQLLGSCATRAENTLVAQPSEQPEGICPRKRLVRHCLCASAKQRRGFTAKVKEIQRECRQCAHSSRAMSGRFRRPGRWPSGRGTARGTGSR